MLLKIYKILLQLILKLVIRIPGNKFITCAGRASLCEKMS